MSTWGAVEHCSCQRSLCGCTVSQGKANTASLATYRSISDKCKHHSRHRQRHSHAMGSERHTRSSHRDRPDAHGHAHCSAT